MRLDRIATAPRRAGIARGVCGLAAVIGMAAATARDAVGAEPDALRATPPAARLTGPEAVQQLVVERDGQGDVGDQVQYLTADPAIASVDGNGMISAQGDGATTIRVVGEGAVVEVPVTVEAVDPGPAINFTNQVVPILTKLGCNTGGCHGKSGGQNGFRLSLLGFEPQLDYETLVKEGRGRRVFPAAPDHSLLLQKAVARVPHGGGKKMEVDSHEYRVLRRWIATGMPMGRAEDPTLSRIEIYPQDRVLERGKGQQLQVTAIYSDGSTEDVTRWAQYESNEPEVAEVAAGGRVTTGDLAGQAAIMARYQSQVTVFRATVPLGLEIVDAPGFVPRNFLDELAASQWARLGVAPSEPCTDAEFARRASLDITGTLPTAETVRAFVADGDPEKRSKLIDRLLDSPEYATFFATKWADILRNKRDGQADLQAATYRFTNWIRTNLEQNVPYDEFARGILAASGTPEQAPPVQWYRQLRSPDAFVDDTAQVFLGMRLQCAKCHHHPLERWSEEDYYSFAAFFSRVGRKPAPMARRVGRNRDEAIYTARSGVVRHPKTNEVMEPRGLGAEVVPISADDDPRQKLVDWMAEPENPYFARALVNRYWAHFFGRGIVEPMDDMRLTNPASNPELLDALANRFVASGYDLRELVRTIATSQLYGLSSVPNAYNERDRQSFARYYPKRMQAEVLLDAISSVTGTPTSFNGLPAGTRAIALPDESVGSTFLDTFGRPPRDSACECERVSDASLGQSLMLLNSADVQAKLTAEVGRATSLAATTTDDEPDAQKIEGLFWAAFGRAPSSSELATALGHLEANAEDRQRAYEDILWALVNAKEFQFID